MLTSNFDSCDLNNTSLFVAGWVLVNVNYFLFVAAEALTF